jgi:hypothetical protein
MGSIYDVIMGTSVVIVIFSVAFLAWRVSREN